VDAQRVLAIASHRDTRPGRAARPRESAWRHVHRGPRARATGDGRGRRAAAKTADADACSRLGRRLDRRWRRCRGVTRGCRSSPCRRPTRVGGHAVLGVDGEGAQDDRRRPGGVARVVLYDPTLTPRCVRPRRGERVQRLARGGGDGAPAQPVSTRSRGGRGAGWRGAAQRRAGAAVRGVGWLVRVRGGPVRGHHKLCTCSAARSGSRSPAPAFVLAHVLGVHCAGRAEVAGVSGPSGVDGRGGGPCAPSRDAHGIPGAAGAGLSEAGVAEAAALRRPSCPATTRCR
jgi:hypothetical protein